MFDIILFLWVAQPRLHKHLSRSVATGEAAIAPRNPATLRAVPGCEGASEESPLIVGDHDNRHALHSPIFPWPADHSYPHSFGGSSSLPLFPSPCPASPALTAKAMGTVASTDHHPAGNSKVVKQSCLDAGQEENNRPQGQDESREVVQLGLGGHG